MSTLVVVAAVGAATAAALGVGGFDTPPETVRPPQVPTAQVTRESLTDVVTGDGKLEYGVAAPVTSRATGTLTWLPPVDTVVSRGEALLRADEKPVMLLYGTLPMYRPLTIGVKGKDVEQLERNLRALGYTGHTVDTNFTLATQGAVKRWQKSLERDQTGTVEPVDVIYAAGPLRIARHTVRVGAVATGDVLMATTTRRSVTMNVSGTDQRMAKIGNRVTVILPNGKKVNGKVVAVGQNANDADMDAANQSETGGPSNTGEISGATQGIPVMINLMNHDALGKLAHTGVSVQYVAATRRNVLAVPVQALVALAEGGYGLEIRDTPTPRVVAVKVGLFAGAKVEVTGGGITEGTTIGMAE